MTTTLNNGVFTETRTQTTIDRARGAQSLVAQRTLRNFRRAQRAI